MTWQHVFVAFIIAHMLSDFAVRREILRRKNGPPAQPLWQHLAAFAVISFGLMAVLKPPGLYTLMSALGAVAGALLHYVVDSIFSRTSMWNADVGPKQRWLFVVQQAIKVGLLFLLAHLLDVVTAEPFSGFAPYPEFCISPNFYAYAFGYTLAIFGGDAFVSFVLTKLGSDGEATQESSEGAGRLIGIFESILVTTFVIGQQYGAVGLVLAAKSVARFEWLKNDQGRTEYFLIGTLANLTCSLFAGLAVLWIAGFPPFCR